MREGCFGAIPGLINAKRTIRADLKSVDSKPSTIVEINYERRRVSGLDAEPHEVRFNTPDGLPLRTPPQPEPAEEPRPPDPGEQRRSRITTSEGTAIAFVGRPGVLKEIM